MDWAKRRKILIETVLTLIGVAIIASVIIATVYKAPSCTDNIQDGNETGVDCGGPCPYLCSVNEIAPQVTFVRAVSPIAGRTDVIAYIDNVNNNAQIQNAEYNVDLYDQFNRLVASNTGTVALPPATTVPVFIPDFYMGPDTVTTAFLSFSTSTLQWEHDSARPVVPKQSQLQILDGPSPKITATLTNPTAYPIYNQTVVATVFNSKNNAIAASQTVVPILSAQGSAPIVFTWNQEFTSKPVRVEILPSY